MRSCETLTEAIEQLHGLDLGTLADAELEEHLLELDRELARLTALHAQALAAVDARRIWAADGSKSCAAWLARKRNGSRTFTASALRLGRSLRSMPATNEALAGGTIAVEHALELAACRRFAPLEFADFEAQLLEYARGLSFDDFRRVCAAWRDCVDATADEKRTDRLYQRRHLVLHRRPDGSLVFQSGELDPVSAEAFLNELERLERELFRQDWAEAKAEFGDDVTVAQLHRSAAQRRADALVEMAHRSRTAPADGQRPRPLVSVYVDYQTVTGRLCELASGTQITAKQLLPIFTQADIERVVFGPRNRVIELGVRARFFTGGLRRAIELRDRHCRSCGCDTPADQCHVDHIVEHSDGGPTTQDNGRLACPRHNQARNGADPPDWDDDAWDDGPWDDEEAEPEDEIQEVDEFIRVCIRELIRCRRDGPSQSMASTTAGSTW